MGIGESWDETKLKAYPAGSFLSEPPKLPHFTWAKDGEVILQSPASAQRQQHRSQLGRVGDQRTRHFESNGQIILSVGADRRRPFDPACQSRTDCAGEAKFNWACAPGTKIRMRWIDAKVGTAATWPHS